MLCDDGKKPVGCRNGSSMLAAPIQASRSATDCIENHADGIKQIRQCLAFNYKSAGAPEAAWGSRYSVRSDKAALRLVCYKTLACNKCLQAVFWVSLR